MALPTSSPSSLKAKACASASVEAPCPCASAWTTPYRSPKALRPRMKKESSIRDLKPENIFITLARQSGRSFDSRSTDRALSLRFACLERLYRLSQGVMGSWGNLGVSD
jgi:hypothetical protein